MIDEDEVYNRLAEAEDAEDRAAVCRDLADQIGDFAEFISRRAGIGPAVMMIATATTMLEQHLNYCPRGREQESLERLITTIREHHHTMMMEDEAAQAVEVAEARRKGQMQ